MNDVLPNPQDLSIWDDLFSDVPEEWRSAPPSMAMRTCAEWLRQVGVRSVLDVGCGVGRWTLWLHRQGFDSAGADFSPNAVEYARAWAADEGLQIPFACVPVTRRPFAERRFDAVVAALVLDLIAKPELKAALEVIRATLKPRGHLFAVFNPVDPPPPEDQANNPTAGVTLINYDDDEIDAILSEACFALRRRELLDLDTRGFLWQLSSGARHVPDQEGDVR